MLRTARGIVCVIAVLACLVGTASAQPADYRTFFTFSQPVQLPSVTLAAGKYIFRLGDPDSSRKVIQVLNEDGSKIFATLLTIPNQRLEPPQDPEVRFMEMPEGTPRAIKMWWYPGNSIGYEFIYPREQATRIAKASNQSVLTTEKQTSSTEETKTVALTRVSPTGSDTKVEESASAASRSDRDRDRTTASARVTDQSPTSQEAVGTAGRSARTELPRTASRMPITGLAGALALLGAAGLWILRRQAQA